MERTLRHRCCGGKKVECFLFVAKNFSRQSTGFFFVTIFCLTVNNKKIPRQQDGGNFFVREILSDELSEGDAGIVSAEAERI